MKKRNLLLSSFFALGLASASAQGVDANDPVLLTIDDEPIYLSEFKYVYDKNNAVGAVEKKSVEEYLELFENYKLKVLDAKLKGLDKSGSYVKDYHHYRSQLAIPYVVDPEQRDFLCREAWDRSKKIVNCSHILAKDDPVYPRKSLERINEIKKLLDSGRSFEELAATMSDCPSKKDSGRLGDTHVFDMVYDFENVIFNLKPGEVSQPFKTRFGYHIAKVNSVRDEPARRRASVLFISHDNPRSQFLIDSMMDRLDHGEDFVRLANTCSESGFGSDRNGLLDWCSLGSNTFPEAVTVTIMTLKKGEYRRLNTPYGWCIFRLDSTNNDITYESMRPLVEKKVMQTERAGKLFSGFTSNLRTRYSFEFDPNALYQFEPLVSDSDYGSYKKKLSLMDAPLFKINDVSYSQREFDEAFTRAKGEWSGVKKKAVAGEIAKKYAGVKRDSDLVLLVFDRMIDEKLLDMAYADLGKRNPEFRNVLTEYSDGLLLFDVSHSEVWRKTNCVVGCRELHEYFDANRFRYKTSEPRFSGLVVYSKSSKVRKQVEKLFDAYSQMPLDSVNSALYKKFNPNSKNPDIIIKYNTFKKGENSAVDFYVYNKDKNNGAKYVSDIKDFADVSVLGSINSDPFNLKEVKGKVSEDFQADAEKKWIERLRDEHTIVVNRDVLKQLK